MKNVFVLSSLLLLVLPRPSVVGEPGCCGGCGCHCNVKKVCRLVGEEKEVKEFEWDCELIPSGSWIDEPAVSTGALQDRDGIDGEYFRNRIRTLGIEEVISASRSPWQNPYVERLIGSIRRAT